MSKPQFAWAAANAANIGRSAGGYTRDMFWEDFPQFFHSDSGRALLPDTMLAEFIHQADAAIQPEKWPDSWRYACGLYVAHHAVLYLRTYSHGSDSPAQAAASGALVGVVKSAQLGDSSVTYDTSALTRATEAWGDLNATQYGQLLAAKARLAGMGGTYIL